MKFSLKNEQSKLIFSKVQFEKERFYNFFSHKQTKISLIPFSKEETYKYSAQLKQLIHQWLEYQKYLHQKKHITSQPRIYFSLNIPAKLAQQIPQQSSRIQKQSLSQSLQQGNLSKQLISYISANHPIFKRINFNLAETLINIGTFTIYNKNDEIPFIFYDEKHKNQCNERKRLGIIMYGRFKLHDKVNNFEKIIDENDSIGEHGIETLVINFSDFRNIKVKSIDQETAILWIKKNHYEILFKQSMKCGLKEEIKKFQSHLKLSWIKKSIKKC